MKRESFTSCPRSHKIPPYTHESDQMSTKPSNLKSLALALSRIVMGVGLLSLSTHLALESGSYLEVLNHNGLNQYHAFGLLVCLSFLSGIFLIAQHVLVQDRAEIDEGFERALSY